MNTSNKPRNFTALSLFVPILLLLGGCASTQDPAAEFKGQSAHQIFEGGEKALADKNYATAVKHYEALDALYPFSDDEQQAMLDSIYAYYQDGDYASSSAAAARFIHHYPASAHIDYALYMKGAAEMIEDKSWPQRYLPIDISSRDPGMARNAFEDFGLLLQQYPNSLYGPDARARMLYLRNLLAKKEADIAVFYYNKKAYVAAANRASEVLLHYDGTPAEEEALVIMVKSYRALGQKIEADKALAVLALNFPNNRDLKSLQQK